MNDFKNTISIKFNELSSKKKIERQNKTLFELK